MSRTIVMDGNDVIAVPLLPPIIPDLSVLLSPWGVWLTQRLSRVAPTWLPRCLVQLLEGDGLPLDPALAGKLAPAIAVWNQCWPDLVQRRQVHWFADALDMSHAPKGQPPALLDRLDALAAALDRKIPPDVVERYSELDLLLLDGARDALALAAALPDEQPVVLSSLSHGDALPWVCRALDRFGLTSHRLADETLRDVMASRLLRGFAYAGLGPLLGEGVLGLAAVHVAAAGTSLPLPTPRPTAGGALRGEPTQDALTMLFDDEADDVLWLNTVAVWYNLP